MVTQWFYIHQAREREEMDRLERMKWRIVEALPRLCPECRKVIEEKGEAA